MEAEVRFKEKPDPYRKIIQTEEIAGLLKERAEQPDLGEFD